MIWFEIIMMIKSGLQMLYLRYPKTRLVSNLKFCSRSELIALIVLHFVLRFLKTEKLLFTISNYRDNNCSNKNV